MVGIFKLDKQLSIIYSVANGYGEIDTKIFIPKPKNPTIARIFKEIGWAEELGSGIRNIEKYSKIYSKHKPVLIEGDVFKTVVEIKGQAISDKTSDKASDKASDKTSRNILKLRTPKKPLAP